MRLYLSVLLAVTLFSTSCLPLVNTEEEQHSIDKRHVGAMARTGQLPFQGKRSYASLARNGDLPFYVRKEWNKKMHPMMTGGRNLGDILPGKRYVGALAKGGNMPFNRIEGKRSDDTEIDNLLQSVLETEDLWRLQLKALKQELLREQQEELDIPEDETGEEKRNVASLARGGSLHGKRSVEALARAGYLPVPKQPQESEEYSRESSEDSEELIGKRSIAALAKNGLLGTQGINMDEGKRGGIGSLARNGYMHQKRIAEDANDLDELIQELYEEEEAAGKRNVGSLARGFNLPYSSGKRNLGSLARAGGLRFGSAKRDEDTDDFLLDEDKRNIASMVRNKISPFQEGKRFLGSVMRNQNSQFAASKKDDIDEDKRNIGAMARNWHLPDHLKFGKRLDDEETDVEDVAKRYVAALMRNGGIPLGVTSSDIDEGKRHIGSLAAKGAYQIHKKSSRSTGSDDAAYNNTQQADAATKSKRSVQNEENQIPASTVGEASKRSKRQAAFLVPASSSDEFPMPVMQNSELFDYEDLAELLSGNAAPEKRFLGRIPQMGRNRPKVTPPSGRRRPHSRNI